MHEMVTGVGRQLLPIRSPHLLCTLFRSRLRERERKKRKHLRGLRLPDVGRAQELK